ncbi:MAG: hypothetical protein KGQ58_07300 [Proteobacteria bacterium]|nr:hypothetical protein [Pseudomonadota bacterium]MDE3207635.1 hypothetical protein [Pseudomonadota bacterium]
MDMSHHKLVQQRRYRIIFLTEKNRRYLNLQKRLLESDRFEMIGEASCISDGMLLAKLCAPDLLLVSAGLGNADNQNLKNTFQQITPECQILFLQDEIQASRRCNHQNPDPIVTINDTAEILYAKLLGTKKQAGEHYLTKREEQILALLATGQCNKLIGRALNISEGTVKVHVKHILKKLKLRTRLEAALWILSHAPKNPLSLT